ncbi:hypothetical protein F2P79_024696 [Pimephales promelas]|nr:hypothetical protein F2P79_024696 [Pimephales promelas]
MSGFFARLGLITLLIAGAVSVHVHETDRVKKGQKWFLVENKSESEHISLSKLELYEANADCKPLSEILRYCSLEEQSYGCVYKNGSTFLLEFEKSGVSLTPLLNATDGCYVAIYIFSNNSKVKKKFQVGLNAKGELPRTVSKDGKLLAVIGVCIGVVVVGITLSIISCLCRKKKKNRDSKKDRKNSVRKGNNEVDSSPSSSSEGDKKKRTMKRKGKGKK